MLTFLLFLSFFANIVFAADTECPMVTTPGADRRTYKNKLRLVQYNVEWLFIDYYSSSNCNVYSICDIILSYYIVLYLNSFLFIFKPFLNHF